MSEQPTDEDSSPQATEPGATGAERPGRPGPLPTGLHASLGGRKLTICHRTSSRLNPYNQITIAEEAVIRRGHSEHTGPIFAPGVENWGDIIPPIPPELPRGLNWPEGQSVLNNGCEVQPDVGPLPSASIGEVECVGTTPQVGVTVTNGAAATAPAFFAVLVDGVVVETVGPVAPGDSQTVTLTGDPGGGLEGQEDETITVEVRSGGAVIDSRVLTVDCPPPPPDVDIGAQLACAGDVAQGSVTVTNNGQDAVVVTAEVDGVPVGTPLTVAPGATETATADLSPFEDQTITVVILVNGDEAATYTVTPDCVDPQASPSVSVAGQECPPPSATVTLGNTGDPGLAGGVRDPGRREGRAEERADLRRRHHDDRRGPVAIRGPDRGRRAPGQRRGAGEPHDPRELLDRGWSRSWNRRRCIRLVCAAWRSTRVRGVLPSVGAGFGLSVIALALGLLAGGSL